MCGLPSLLHKGSICTCGNRAELLEECQISQEYRMMIKSFVFWIKRKENKKTQWTKGWETLIDKIGTSKDTRLDTLIETLEKK